jgi:hypothetical protein
VLDSALLDYESMSEEFGDVAFEGEWNFLKSLTGRGGTAAKKAAGRIVPKARDVFAQAANGGVGTNHDEGAGFGYGSVREARPRGSIDAGNGSSGSGGGNGRPLSVADFRSSVVAGRTSQPLSPSGSYSSGKNPLFSSTSLSLEKSSSQSKPPSSSEITPRTITSFLTSILVILQLYEVNPAITCQAFSQVYYWVGCEAFNRIITRKKYLCRSKAVQIRMNMTALEDWVRESGLPVRTATKHLEPVNQLLQWLQTCSSLREFDNLIVMVQNLKSLNPLQMRRAISDYRFEVGEGKMSDECSQYLAQLQKDWEKRRVRIGVETLQREISGKERARIDKYGDGSNGGPGSPSTHANPPSEDKPYNPSLLSTPSSILPSLSELTTLPARPSVWASSSTPDSCSPSPSPPTSTSLSPPLSQTRPLPSSPPFPLPTPRSHLSPAPPLLPPPLPSLRHRLVSAREARQRACDRCCTRGDRGTRSESCRTTFSIGSRARNRSICVETDRSLSDLPTLSRYLARECRSNPPHRHLLCTIDLFLPFL